MHYYKPHHFEVQELVDPVTFAERGEDALQLLNADLLYALDGLRDKYGPMTINNWHLKLGATLDQYKDKAWRAANGVFIFRGFRPWWCNEGTPYSMHRVGGAFDIDFAKVTAEKVRQDMKASPDATEFTLIKAVEVGTSWLHIDARNIPEDLRIMWVNP